jgi:hypothetical protein
LGSDRQSGDRPDAHLQISTAFWLTQLCHKSIAQCKFCLAAI